MNRIKLGILQTNHDKSVAVGDAFPDDVHRFRDLFDAQESLAKRISSIRAISEPGWTRSNFKCGVKTLPVKVEANS